MPARIRPAPRDQPRCDAGDESDGDNGEQRCYRAAVDQQQQADDQYQGRDADDRQGAVEGFLAVGELSQLTGHAIAQVGAVDEGGELVAEVPDRLGELGVVRVAFQGDVGQLDGLVRGDEL